MLQIPDSKLKEILLRDGILKAEDFDAIAAEAQRMGQGTANILIARNTISSIYFNSIVAEYYGVEWANVLGQVIDDAVINLLPEDIARQKRVIVFGRQQDGTLNVAMEDPNNLETIDFLQQFLRAPIKPFLAAQEDLNRGFVFYGKKSSEDFKRIIEENIKESLRIKVSGVKEAAVEVPIISIVDNIMSYAISLRASDIHLEILEDNILVRYRIDGILHEIIRIPQEVHPALVARFKLLAGLKLDEHAKPQDGRFRYKVGHDVMDIRLAIMPIFYGEKVEMRLLASTERPLSLEELGMLEDTIKIVADNIKKTFGMVLITGPTGSGKSTTLYSILNILNRPEVNIVTVEDPIEYDMKYINQTQINPASGITFASGLRAIVRQDPNIILVGEIRDEETADISVQAALTGHLVLSSLHTNDVPTAIPRLIDMHIPPFLVAAVLNLLVAQRLVRRICLSCIASYELTPTEREAIEKQITELKIEKTHLPKLLYHGTGCAACGGIGYKGRLAIFEALHVDEIVRNLIIDPNFSLDKLREAARKNGMITMFEDGLRKVERGMTTIEEVLRVIKE